MSRALGFHVRVYPATEVVQSVRPKDVDIGGEEPMDVFVRDDALKEGCGVNKGRKMTLPSRRFFHNVVHAFD
jgi:hypothetical protein